MLIVIIIVFLLLLLGLPRWSFWHGGYGPGGYGYWPSGVLALALLVLLVMWLAGGG